MKTHYFKMIHFIAIPVRAKRLIIMFCACSGLCFSSNSYAQLVHNSSKASGASYHNKISISGKVSKSDGTPVAYVAVGILNSHKSTLTNEKGIFKINGIQPGKITLKVHGNGIASETKTVFVNAGAVNSVNFTVRDTIKHLKAVVVAYSRNKFSTKGSDYVAKMPLKSLENPQAYTVITYALMKEQMDIDYSSAFKNIPGTEVPSYAYNGRMDISSRGFKVRSQIIDGMSGYTMTNIDPANIEKIEVVRGPSATLYGSSLTSYGGLINIVTKQPYDRFGGNASYYLGSFGTNRLTLDVNSPVNKKRTLLFRINAAGQTGKSCQDAGFDKSVFVAPSLEFKPAKNISLTANFEYYAHRATSPFWFEPYKKTDIFDVRDLGFDKENSFANNDIYYNAQQLNARLRADITISKTWKSTTLFAATDNKLNGLMTYLSGLSDSTLNHNVVDGPEKYVTIEVQQNFLNDEKFGKSRNRLLLGLDFYHYKENVTTATLKIDTVNFLHPQNQDDIYTKENVTARLKNEKYNTTISSQNTYSAYLSDVFSYNDRWFLMAGLRLDRFENGGEYNPSNEMTTDQFGQTALSPKIGLLYQLIPKKVSVYANYMNGFSNVNGADYEGNIFKPQHANQVETGVKVSGWKGRIVGTISAYRILVNNMLRADLEHPQFSVQDGTELSKGIEVSAAVNPIRNLNIIAGYAYNYCVYQKAADGLQGRRPDGAGPQNTANLWVSYKLGNGFLKGLGFGLGGRYGSRLTTIKSFTPVFLVPSYQVFDATLYYEHSFYRIGIKVDNLNNETYWDNRLRWQSPRSITAGLTVNF